tara:strand:+ start:605 stop:1294 length:690 start_codon:yes stop_codon:yes gene_type:complete
MSFDFSLILESVPRMFTGIGLTLQLLVLATILGTILAVIIALMRISNIPLLNWPAIVYIYIFRGTPMLVQIFVIYYGLSQFQTIRDSFLWIALREPFWCAIIAFSLNAGAYTAEILRGAIQGVDKGLLKASTALGLSKSQSFVHITTPIAIRLALPAFGNETISLLKSTALASIITMFDITGVARTIMAETFAPYEVFISAAIVYLFIAWFIQLGITIAERRFNRYMQI